MSGARRIRETQSFTAVLAVMLTAGFIEVDELRSTRWERTLYRWTAAGREACLSYAGNMTPEGWANLCSDYQGARRHCWTCGRDLYRKTTWAHERERLVCMACGQGGKTLDR